MLLPNCLFFFGSVEAFLATNNISPDLQVLGMFHLILHSLFMAVSKGGHSPDGARAILKSSAVGLAARGDQFPSVARRLLISYVAVQGRHVVRRENI